jgi:formylglycine-generating enzyme required for sulfatase activity
VTFEEYDHFAEVTARETPDDEGQGRGRHPVVNVSWDDAKAYVAWLAAETSQPYRLPSEAEWEYACRAGTMTRYWWGDEITPENANYGQNVGRTSVVGTYAGSPWGLHDMHGNVGEFVEDCFHPSYDGAPADGSAWRTEDCHSRVSRWGCWMSTPAAVRSASRFMTGTNRGFDHLGFRVARTLAT